MALWTSSDSWSVVTQGLSEFSAAIVPTRSKPDDPAGLPWLLWLLCEQAASASTATIAAIAETVAREGRQPPAPTWPNCLTAIELTRPCHGSSPIAVPGGVQYLADRSTIGRL